MSESGTPRQLLRHTVATLAYRLAKAVRGAPEHFAQLQVEPSVRTPIQILTHIGDLFDWALSMAQGTQVWKESTPLPWHDEVKRTFNTLAHFDAYLASEAPIALSVERLFQGPIADALTHTGQLTMLRRLAGSPIRGENYAKADIEAGHTGFEQLAPKQEFG